MGKSSGLSVSQPDMAFDYCVRLLQKKAYFTIISTLRFILSNLELISNLRKNSVCLALVESLAQIPARMDPSRVFSR